MKGTLDSIIINGVRYDAEKPTWAIECCKECDFHEMCDDTIFSKWCQEIIGNNILKKSNKQFEL